MAVLWQPEPDNGTAPSSVYRCRTEGDPVNRLGEWDLVAEYQTLPDAQADVAILSAAHPTTTYQVERYDGGATIVLGTVP